MRIVYLSASGQMGGAERSLLDVLASIHAAQPKWSLHLIVPENGSLAAKATALGVPTTVLPFPSTLARLGDAGAGGTAGGQINRLTLLLKLASAVPAIAYYVKRLRHEFHRMSPDVVHSNGFKMHVLSMWAQPSRQLPVVWHIHDYVSTRPLMARLMRRYAARCAAAVTNSHSVADDVREVCGEKLKIHPVHNAVDLEVFTPDGSQLDLDALAGLTPVQPGTVRVGLLATMARWKGHETFLKALSILPDEMPIRGYIVGGPIYQTDESQYAPADLHRLAASLGIENKVGFTGYVEDAASAMRALDIIVHASTQPEPFGLVIAEGMACGRSVIASHAGGVAEIVANGMMVHSPGDDTTLAEQIKRLVEDAHLRARLGDVGRATAERQFDRTRLAAELIPIYREAAQTAN